jgi:hypothetical protein
MQITNEIIKGVLRGTFSDAEAIIHQGMHFHLDDIVSRITVGLNEIIARGDMMEFLKREQDNLDTLHVEATGEIETEMALLQEECPHSSHTMISIPPRDMWSHATCDICGKLLSQEEMDNAIQ